MVPRSAAPGSATKTVIRLHDRIAFGYTADGRPFAAVILVSDPGGSGTGLTNPLPMIHFDLGKDEVKQQFYPLGLDDHLRNPYAIQQYDWLRAIETHLKILKTQ